MSFLNRLAGSLRPNSLDRDLTEEQEHHIELAARELEAQGMAPGEARRQAQLTFGNRALAREETHRQDSLSRLDDFARDLRIAWRGLRRSPSYSLVVLIAFALGIGANTAIFSLVQAVLLRPFPYPDSGRLTFIYTRLANGRRGLVNYEDFRDLRRDSKAFSDIAGMVSQTVNLTGSGEPDRLRGGFASHNFFSMLGGRVAGRTFLAAEEIPNGPRVAIASWGLWQTKFGGKDNFLNSTILLNGEPHTIIGILPRNFDLPFDQIDVWMPYPLWPPFQPGRAGSIIVGLGRVRPGVTLAAAEEELTVRARAAAAEFPGTNRDRIGAQVVSMRASLTENLRPQLVALGGAVLLALLVACANIATLTVSRVLSRSRELGIRAALGAGRARLMGHLCSEQPLLAFSGAALGLLVALWFTRLAILSDQLPPMLLPRVDWRVALASLVLAMLAALLTGPLPAFSLLRGKMLDVSSGGRSSSDTRAASRTRQILVTLSMAVSVILLAGAGLMVRSFNKLSNIDPGFRPENLITLEYRMPQSRYTKPEQQVEFHRRVAEQASTVPGVRSATVMMALPFSGNGHFGPYEIVGLPPAARGSEPRAQLNRVDARYFETMGISRLRGRLFEGTDRLGTPRVAVVSKSMAERCWPGEDPLGRQLMLVRDSGGPFTVVGVVGDSKHNSLEEESRDKAYVPFAQYPHIFGTLAARTTGDPTTYASLVRQAVWNVDKDQPVWKVRSMDSLIDGSVSNRRALASLMGAFSGFALLLATIGLYGVVSYTMTRRRKELGIRAAMGATRNVLVKMVVGQGMRNIGIGLVIGLACAIPASRLLTTRLLFQTQVTDPEPYLVAVLALAGAALLATLIPARRVATISPSDVLRQD
ncbi:MAG: ADOP family duplicated permease [Bryobacteraceae bacterium]